MTNPNFCFKGRRLILFVLIFICPTAAAVPRLHFNGPIGKVLNRHTEEALTLKRLQNDPHFKVGMTRYFVLVPTLRSLKNSWPYIFVPLKTRSLSAAQKGNDVIRRTTTVQIIRIKISGFGICFSEFWCIGLPGGFWFI